MLFYATTYASIEEVKETHGELVEYESGPYDDGQSAFLIDDDLMDDNVLHRLDVEGCAEFEDRAGIAWNVEMP